MLSPVTSVTTRQSLRGLTQHNRMKHRAPKLASTPASPECPRQKPRTSGSLSASPLLETNREEYVESEEESEECEDEPEVLSSSVIIVITGSFGTNHP